MRLWVLAVVLVVALVVGVAVALLFNGYFPVERFIPIDPVEPHMHP